VVIKLKKYRVNQITPMIDNAHSDLINFGLPTVFFIMRGGGGLFVLTVCHNERLLQLVPQNQFFHHDKDEILMLPVLLYHNLCKTFLNLYISLIIGNFLYLINTFFTKILKIMAYNVPVVCDVRRG
jgi:hypothetical protein